jgi:transcription elongation factor Elf1
MADGYTLSCSHCGAAHQMTEYFAILYAGRKVTRWCETCHRMFAVQVPPSIVPPATDAGR